MLEHIKRFWVTSDKCIPVSIFLPTQCLEGEEREKQNVIDALSQYDKLVLKTALAYAYNLCTYGVDVTEKWYTATQQAYALDKAYRKGFEECSKQAHNACATCKSRLEGLDPIIKNDNNHAGL